MKRRELLAGVGSLVLAGCGERDRAEPAPEPEPRTEPPTPQPPVAPEPVAAPEPVPVTDADWVRLRDGLQGSLVRPSDSRYAHARKLYHPRFDHLAPQGVAYAETEADVQRLIEFARTHGTPFAARCGGHSYGGYSSGAGIVCDVGPMSGVEVQGTRATIGSGAKLIDIYHHLAPRGLLLPGGTCPSVGISGLTLGGGQGVVGRKLGLTCDALRSMRMITADGTIHECSNDDDLFWASRGGGGGNFGVATKFEFDVTPVAQLTRFALPYRWDAAKDVFAAWQEWGPDAPDEIWSKVEIGARDSRRSIAIHGVFIGAPDALEAHLDAFVRIAGRPRRRRVESASLFDTILVLGGCARRTYEECHLPPEGTLSRGVHLTRSDVFAQLLSSDAIETLLQRMDRSGMEYSGRVGIDALGGAIGRVDPSATAFVHRRARFIAQYATYWRMSASPEVVAANTEWMNRLYESMHPHAAGAYSNYIDPDLSGWEQAYYGANFERLRAIKTQHDPHRVFDFAQAIRPA